MQVQEAGWGPDNSKYAGKHKKWLIKGQHQALPLPQLLACSQWSLSDLIALRNHAKLGQSDRETQNRENNENDGRSRP